MSSDTNDELCQHFMFGVDFLGKSGFTIKYNN